MNDGSVVLSSRGVGALAHSRVTNPGGSARLGGQGSIVWASWWIEKLATAATGGEWRAAMMRPNALGDLPVTRVHSCRTMSRRVMNPILDADDVRSGLRAVDVFWRDLGRDDDQAVAAVLAPEAVSILGGGPGLAERIRERLRISVVSCSCLGAVSPVLLAGDRWMRPTYTFTSVPISGGRDGQDAAWSIDVADMDGVWRIDPTASRRMVEVGHRWISLGMVWSRIADER